MNKKIVIIIPARYKSTRFPGKPLILLKGVPMVVRVAQICEKVVPKENVFIATESEIIKKAVEQYNFTGILTSDDNLTGTDRIAEAAEKIDAHIFVNVQGDEPLISSEDIKKVIEAKKEFPNYIINAMTEFDPATNSVNIPKVVTNESGDLLYMSRSLIPGSKSMAFNYKILKQVCIYAFTKEELFAFKKFGRKSFLENLEDIEILRFFELGYRVKMVKVSGSSLAVDVPEDVTRVEKKL
jgi:3-deoxy-manno-octulosonate cytidylyltransferase (CMP-KDO synthetase)